MFLVQLLVVEAFVAEVGSVRSCGLGARGGWRMLGLGARFSVLRQRRYSRSAFRFNEERILKRTDFLTPKQLGCYIGMMQPGCMHFGFPSIVSDSAKNAIEGAMACFGTLHGHGFSHHWATAGEELEIGHGPTARRNMADRG